MVYIDPRKYCIVKCGHCGSLVGYKNEDVFKTTVFSIDAMDNIVYSGIICPSCYKDIKLLERGAK